MSLNSRERRRAQRDKAAVINFVKAELRRLVELRIVELPAGRTVDDYGPDEPMKMIVNSLERAAALRKADRGEA